ncbi:DNA polymerase III subunit beta [Deinococcus cellulosilyticus]|uniref:Beta sliding clamp n=1 Tax=Deinococcus cellulosilyticus (strain DSM 18568 / NBRC 106333 / KACC 11606 / 5516J-15) TaxID=1223518 RepID=A0A511NAA5_DEIC1|nr:DNA polymerase III subunit beta [Deinococcus cellulosilyticus]GEM49497.1 DNA polymerase III subunit beta [Deinococcus cellulosilyticus NBRC 106333 = KACC 11606]
MQIQVTKKFLSDALSTLERIIPARSNNPVLSYVKIQPSDRGIYLSGTNLELDMEGFVPAQVENGQAVIVPAHLFAQIVRNLPGELVEINLNQSEITLTSGGSNFKLQTGDLSAFPEIQFPSHSDVEMDAKELNRSLSSVRYATATEAFQQVFRGIKFELRAKQVRLVASDGFRLALRDFTGSGVDRNLIVPAKSADELNRILKEGLVKLTFGDHLLSVASDRTKMNIKLLDGEFPDYERVIPSNIKVKVQLPASKLKEAVSRVAVLADKNANNRVEFLVSESKLQLIAEGDYGRAQEVLEVLQEGSEPAISLGFNAKFVSDALGPMEGDVVLQLSGVTTPALFKTTDESGYLAVVVPLRI